MPIRPPTHRASGEARRAALLDAAIDVIAEDGIGGATHRAIAARAGMPLSTTSYFFASLDELIAAAMQVVADRLSTRVHERIAAILDAGLSRDEAISQLADMLLDAPARDVVAQFETYLECARKPELQAAAHQFLVSTERAAEAALRALGVASPAERAPMVVAMLDGLALHRHAWPRHQTDRPTLHDGLRSLLNAFAPATSSRVGRVALDRTSLLVRRVVGGESRGEETRDRPCDCAEQEGCARLPTR